MEYRTYKYRWVILAAIVPIIVCTEMFWLTLAPVSSLAESYYHADSMGISMFATSYMIMYILFTIPASWVIDKFGYRCSLIIGALITAVFGILRALFAPHFAAVLTFQFIIAIGQPFLLNISTKVPANWFPVSERSIAAGILTMAQYLGFVVPMVLSPILAQQYGIPSVYKVFAMIACICAAVSILLTRERPAVPPGPEAEKEDTSFASMTKLFKNRNFLYVLILAFISMGIFNALLTLIENILKPRGITMDQAGIVGAVFVISGVVGAVLLPILSDKLHRRTRVVCDWYYTDGSVVSFSYVPFKFCSCHGRGQSGRIYHHGLSHRFCSSMGQRLLTQSKKVPLLESYYSWVNCRAPCLSLFLKQLILRHIPLLFLCCYLS